VKALVGRYGFFSFRRGLRKRDAAGYDALAGKYGFLPLRYNLSFFADDDGGEKTEQPTARKRGKAREEGQVAKSAELNTAFLFLAAFFGLRMFAPRMFSSIENVLRFNLMSISDLENVESAHVSGFLNYMFQQALIIASPIMLLSMSAGLVVNFVQVRWAPTTKPLMPKFSKLNPLNGVKRLFSTHTLIELPKSLIKLVIITYVLYSMLMDEMPVILTFMDMEIMQSLIYIGNIAVNMGIRIGLLYLLLAAADYPYQRYKLTKSLKMTKQEVKDEYKMVEGDPKVKAKIKQKMRQASLRRMMQEVPGADVIITNPTHYAVAVKYDKEEALAPMVIAKGVDYLARKIKEKAKECNVEIVENKQLAQTLYKTVDIGREIPVDLYQAVAEILAFVYKLRNKV